MALRSDTARSARWLCLLSVCGLLNAGCGAYDDDSDYGDFDAGMMDAAMDAGIGADAAAGGQGGEGILPGPDAASPGDGGGAGSGGTTGGSGGSPPSSGAGGAAGSGVMDASGEADAAPGDFPGPGGLLADPQNPALQYAAPDRLTEAEVEACLPLPASGGTSEGGPSRESCAEQNCTLLRSCCVGSGSCCTDIDVIGVPQMADLSECSGTDPAECMTDEGWPADGFGPRPAQVRDGALHPGGDETGDSGLLFSTALDVTSHRVRISATFGAASACDQGCLEGVGIGVSYSHELAPHVCGDVSLVYSGSLGQVRLIVGGRVVAEKAMTSEQERWTLELQPSGRARAFQGEGPADGGHDATDAGHASADAGQAAADAVFDAPYSPKPDAKVLVFGRNRDPAADDGARLWDLAVDVALCDIPSGWRNRETVTIRDPDGDDWLPNDINSPSVAYDNAGQALLALEVNGAIHLAERVSGNDNVFQLLSATRSPEFSASAVQDDLGEDVTALRDPSLLWLDAGWILYFAFDADGQGSKLAMARAQPEGAFELGETLIFEGEVGALDAPSVMLHEIDARQYWVMAAREKNPREEPEQQLAIFASLDGVHWSRSGAGGLGAFMAAAAQVMPENFFADGIDSPSLSLHNGAWQLYYAGRRGTRWAIGLLVSDDLLLWRHVPALGPVVAPTGTGFERLSVGQPTATFQDSGVELFYLGSDGYRNRLGRAWRASSDYGVPSGMR